MKPSAEEIQRTIEGQNDFAHELRVGSVLHPDNVEYPAVGLHPRTRIHLPIHGETYRDPLTDKPRQFDYRIKINKDSDGRKNALLALECKNLNPEFPMVI